MVGLFLFLTWTDIFPENRLAVFLNKDDVGVRIYNADTGRFSTFGYGQIDFKYMPGGCRSDPRFHLIHVGLDFFLLTGCYSCNYFKERFRIACDHTRAQSSCNSPHAASDAFYIFDNISTYFNIQLFRQIT